MNKDLKARIDGQAQEVRLLSLPVELRSEEDGDGHLIEGYAAVFGEVSNMGGYFEERIAEGAFDASLSRGDDVTLLINHQGLPLARTGSGSLSLTADQRGLKVSTRLNPDDPDVARIIPKMRRGDLSKMSFAFRAVKTNWDESRDIPLRTLEQVDLFDVSIVTDPAYQGTEIALRGLDLAGLSAAAELRKRQAVQAMRRRGRLSAAI